MSLLTAFVVVTAAGVLTGVTGFGFSVLSVPLLLLLYPPHDVVVIALILVPLTSVVLLAMPHLRGNAQVRIVAALSLFSLVGLPFGLLLFERFDPIWVTGLMGLTLLGYAVYALFGPEEWSLHHNWLPPSGLLGGLLATSTGLSGPAVAMYVHGRRLSAAEQLTTMAAYVGAISVVGVALLAARGAVSAPALVTVAQLVPFAIAGTAAGAVISRRYAAKGDHVIEKVTLVLLALMGVWTLGRVVLSYATKGTLT